MIEIHGNVVEYKNILQISLGKNKTIQLSKVVRQTETELKRGK